MLETNGSSWAQGGIGIVLRTHDELAIAQEIKLSFVVSNNGAEYEVVILELKVVKCLSIASIELQCDS